MDVDVFYGIFFYRGYILMINCAILFAFSFDPNTICILGIGRDRLLLPSLLSFILSNLSNHLIIVSAVLFGLCSYACAFLWHLSHSNLRSLINCFIIAWKRLIRNCIRKCRYFIIRLENF
jgi:hypothetical protein